MTSGIEEQVRDLLRTAVAELPADGTLVARIEHATVAAPRRATGTVAPPRRGFVPPLLAAAAVIAVVATVVAMFGSTGSHPPVPPGSKQPTSTSAAPAPRTTAPAPAPGLSLVPSGYGFLRPEGWVPQPLRSDGGPASRAAFTDTHVSSTLTSPVAASIIYEVNGGSLGLVYDANRRPLLAGALAGVRCGVTSHHVLAANTVAFTCAPVNGQSPTGLIVVEPYPQGTRQLIVTLPPAEQSSATAILDSFRSIGTSTGASAAWTANSIIITPTSLGAVTTGMTLSQAEDAAGLQFNGAGDGAYYPILTSPDAPHLYIRPNGGANFPACVGAEGDGKGTPTVATAEGFQLGGTVTELEAIYGRRLTYAPMPTGGGISPRAGYVLNEPSGTLTFAIDPTSDQTINKIAGSTQPLTPSSCPG